MLRVLIVLVIATSVAYGVPKYYGREVTPVRKSALRLFDQREILGPVYYPRGASVEDPEYLSAQELAEVLARVSDHEWPLLPEEGTGAAPGIYVGHTVRYFIESGQTLRASRDDLNRQPRQSDEYYLYADHESVVIAGNTRAATVRAVSRFLMEHAGVRWFIPGELGESVPERDDLYVTAQSAWQVPDYASRWLRVHDVAWNRHNMLDRWIPSGHGLFKLLDEEIFAEHPEWMPMLNGERMAKRVTHSYASQPEIADPTLASYVAERVDEVFLSHPDEPSVSIGMNDSLAYSESGMSREALLPWTYYRGMPNASPLVFGFSNAVAAQSMAGKAGPDGERYVSQLAYIMHLKPPPFEVDAGVAVYVATDRGQWFDQERRASGMALLEAWGETAQGPWGLRDYYYGEPYLIPRIFPGLISESLAYASEEGASLFTAESNPRWGYDGPKIWLTTQLAQRSGSDAEALLEEYYERFYGPAAGAMRRFFDLCEARWMEQPGKGSWIKYYMNPAQLTLFPPDVCAQLDGFLTEAERSAKMDTREPWAERVALTRELFDQTYAASEFYHVWLAMASNPLATEADRQQFQRDWKSYEQTRADLAAVLPEARRHVAKMQEILLALDARPRLSATDWRGVPLGRLRLDDLSLGEHRPGESTVTSWRLPEGWFMHAWSTEDFRWGVLEASPGGRALRIEGAQSASITERFPVVAGEGFGVRLKVRGQVSPGCQVYLLVTWHDENDEQFETSERAVLPQGEFTEWMSLVVNTRVPEGAREVYVGLRVRTQFPGDWVELRNVLVMNLSEAYVEQARELPVEEGVL